MEHPVSVEGLSPQAQKIVDPNAPIPMKMMAASGLAPLGPKDLVTVLYMLSYDCDDGLSGKARESLGKLPDALLLDTLAQTLHEAVLDGIARILLGREGAIERIILNRGTVGSTVAWLAEQIKSEKLLEMIAANEQRMLQFPKIIEALYCNPNARMSTVDRAIEMAVRNGLELDGIPTFAEAKKAIEGELIFEASEEPSPDDIEFSSALAEQTSKEMDDEEVSKVLESREIGEDLQDEETQKKVVSIEASLSQLTVSQKVRVAMLGNASQRSVLIRDSNKLVIMAVLKSPAVKDAEVMRYSKARSLPEEAIKFIAAKRDWTKHYQVKLNLVSNPRTPIQDALKFLNHLRPNDIRALERSKDIPSVVKNAAKELRKKRSR